MNSQQTNTTGVTPKDFFLHLGAIVALYAGVVALINLSFSIINYYFPDNLAGYFYGNSVAWPISMLVVLTPIFYVIEWMIVKDIKVNQDKAHTWIRRWSIFLTLFITGIVIAGDFITIINTYLNGEIGLRFFLKAVAVFIISCVVFKYYFFTLNNDKYKIASLARKSGAWFGILIVLVAIVTGFITVGSPAKQRAMRFDNQRIADLQNIQWQVVSYWQQKGKLPASLEDLKDPLSGNVIPVDPENDSKYKYTVKNDKTFELCSTFSLDYKDTKGRGEYGGGSRIYPSYSVDSSYPGYGIQDNWEYKAGNSCFERTIDPEKYPQIKKDI